MKNCSEIIQSKRLLYYFRDLVLSWATKHVEPLPWRVTNYNYTGNLHKTLWKVVVAEVLLGRTPTERVLPIFNKIIDAAPTPASFVRLDYNYLVNELKPLGLQKKKVKTLKEVAKVLTMGKLKDVESELKKIKGIGKNTLNAILLFGLCKNRPLMDETIGRVVSRVLGIKWKSKKAVLDKCAWYVSSLLVYDDCNKTKLLFYGLIDIGRKYCKVKNPRCTNCPLIHFCKYSSECLKA